MILIDASPPSLPPSHLPPSPPLENASFIFLFFSDLCQSRGVFFCSVRIVCKNLESKIRPTRGTSYGAGLASAWGVAKGGVNDAGEQFVLIFLSDGRVRERHALHTVQHSECIYIHGQDVHEKQEPNDTPVCFFGSRRGGGSGVPPTAAAGGITRTVCLDMTYERIVLRV